MLATIIGLIVLGLVLLGVEFIIPGAIIGILGIIALITATVLTFTEYGPATGFGVAMLTVFLVIAFFALWVKYFHRTFFGKRMSLDAEVGGTDLYEEQEDLLGKTGVAAIDLRPSGKVIIDGRRIDVVAEVGLIEKDTPVKVVKVEGIKVVVRKDG